MQKVVDRVVIALDDSRRLDAFFQQPAARGFRVFSAVDGRRGRKSLEPLFDFDEAARRWKYEMPVSHAACALSHFRVAEEFARGGGADTDLILVAEDDAHFTPRAPGVIEAVSGGGDPVDLVILADGYGEGEDPGFFGASATDASLSLLCRWVRVNGRTFRYGSYEGAVQGAGLYLLSRGAARRYCDFVTKAGAICWPSDWFHLWAIQAGIVPMLLRPGVAQWRGDSTLGHPPSLDLHAARVARQTRSFSSAQRYYVRSRFRWVKRSVRATLNDIARHATS